LQRNTLPPFAKNTECCVHLNREVNTFTVWVAFTSRCTNGDSAPLHNTQRIQVPYGKCKLIPVTGSGGPQGYETSRLPYFLHNRLTGGGEVSITRRRPPFTLRKIPGTHYCSRLSRPRGIVRLEGLGQLKNLMTSS
jgi:hypothetical protein